MNISRLREILEGRAIGVGRKLINVSRSARARQILREAQQPMARQFVDTHRLQAIEQAMPSRTRALLSRAARARRRELIRAQQELQARLNLSQARLDEYYRMLQSIPEEGVGLRGAIGRQIVAHPGRAVTIGLGLPAIGMSALGTYLYNRSKYGEFSKFAAKPQMNPEELLQFGESLSSLGPSIAQAMKYHTQLKNLSKQYQTLQEVYGKANPIKKMFYTIRGKNPNKILKQMQQAEALRNEAIGNAAGSFIAGGHDIANKYLTLRQLEEARKKQGLYYALGGLATGAAITGGAGAYYLYNKGRNTNGTSKTVPGASAKLSRPQ